jgi:hypothetical protein
MVSLNVAWLILVSQASLSISRQYFLIIILVPKLLLSLPRVIPCPLCLVFLSLNNDTRSGN